MFCSLIVHIQTAADTVKAGIDGYTILTEICYGRIITEFVRPAGYGCLIVLVASPLEQDAVPVDISAPWDRGIIVNLLIGICNCILLSFPIPELAVLEGIVDVLATLFTGHYRPVFHSEIRPAPVRLERNLRLAGLSPLSSDQDYSVSRP